MARFLLGGWRRRFGVLLVFFAPSGWLALLGFAMTGIGTSVIFPLAMSAAAQLTDRPAQANVASLAQVSFVAFPLGPPLLGTSPSILAFAGRLASGYRWSSSASSASGRWEPDH